MHSLLLFLLFNTRKHTHTHTVKLNARIERLFLETLDAFFVVVLVV